MEVCSARALWAPQCRSYSPSSHFGFMRHWAAVMDMNGTSPPLLRAGMIIKVLRRVLVPFPPKAQGPFRGLVGKLARLSEYLCNTIMHRCLHLWFCVILLIISVFFFQVFWMNTLTYCTFKFDCWMIYTRTGHTAFYWRYFVGLAALISLLPPPHTFISPIKGRI